MAPTLILLPGLDGTGRLFRPFCAVLPPTIAPRVISYPTDQVCTFDARFHATENQLQNEREMVLVAESFSGPLALHLAVAHPDRIRAVVLCASFISSPVPRWLTCVTSPFWFRLPIPAFLIRRFLLGGKAPLPLVQEVKNVITSVKRQVLVSRIREVLSLDASEDLRNCAAPILYLQARSDGLVGQANVQQMQAIRPELKVVSVCGPHMLLQTKPAAAWQEITQFLRANNIGCDT